MSPTILQIPVSRLRVGMYLHKLGGSWLDHPFLRNSFLLEDPKDLQRILASGIQSVWIDTSRGLGLEAPAASVPSPAADDEPDSQASRSTTAGLTEAEREEIAQDRMPERFRQPMQSAGPVALHAEIERAREICLSGKQQVMALFGELRLGNSIEPATASSRKACCRWSRRCRPRSCATLRR